MSRKNKKEMYNMKEMKWIGGAYEDLLQKLVMENVRLYNIPHTCIDSASQVDILEVIHSTLPSYISNSDEEFSIILYAATVTQKRQCLCRHSAIVVGSHIPQWAIDRFNKNFGPFAIRIRPQNSECDTTEDKVWIFNMF